MDIMIKLSLILSSFKGTSNTLVSFFLWKHFQITHIQKETTKETRQFHFKALKAVTKNVIF